MIRRTHQHTLFGARLVPLPRPTEHNIWIEFGPVERQIYNIVQKRMVQMINATVRKERNLEKSYSHVWTLILRLRQLCSHPLLIQDTITSVLKREDFEKLDRIAAKEEKKMREDGPRLLKHLRQALSQSQSAVNTNPGIRSAFIATNENVPADMLDVDETQAIGGSHGTNYRFCRYLNKMKESDSFEEMNERVQCVVCRQPPDMPQLTSCFHIYCKDCLDDVEHQSARNGREQSECIKCSRIYDSVEALDLAVKTDLDPGSSSTPNGNKKRKRSKANGDDVDWIGMAGDILPSAKTKAVKCQILEWLQQDSKTKIIIYTQFLPIVRILTRLCKAEDWGSCRYVGTMTQGSRATAIRKFQDDPKINIMLASLKCGGVGLNLTMANRVVCFDPWWNRAVEQQAFCRVFRIGQTKETSMARFVVKNTIETAMMAMKARKQVCNKKLFCANSLLMMMMKPRTELLCANLLLCLG